MYLTGTSQVNGGNANAKNKIWNDDNTDRATLTTGRLASENRNTQRGRAHLICIMSHD